MSSEGLRKELKRGTRIDAEEGGEEFSWGGRALREETARIYEEWLNVEPPN